MEAKELKIIPPEEIWKDAEGFEDFYQVSNMGRVRSLDRIVKSGIRHNKTAKGFRWKYKEMN